jgi:hypothetical protein
MAALPKTILIGKGLAFPDQASFRLVEDALLISSAQRFTKAQLM